MEITRHGKVIGRIVPAGAAGELDDWVAAGRVTPATITGPIPRPRYRASSGTDAGALLRHHRRGALTQYAYRYLHHGRA